MTTKTDELVIELFNKVKQKQADIERSEKPRYLTSCTVGYIPDDVSNRINIQTVTDLNKLIDICAFLRQKESFYDDAVKVLGLPEQKKWMGYTFKEWYHDLVARVNQIKVNDKKKELKVLESRLDSLISVDQRRELELAKIQELLK